MPVGGVGAGRRRSARSKKHSWRAVASNARINWSPIPPVVAAVVAVVVAVTRRLPPLLVGTSIAAPSPERIALYALAGRFVSFVLIYGLLFGVAVAVGRRGSTGGDGTTDGSETTDGDGVTALATGVVGAVAYLVASAALLLVLDPIPPLTNAIAGFGSSVGIGVRLAVVAFAGLALADRLYYL